MLFLKSSGSYEELGDAWVGYRKYLLSIEEQLPPDVFQFATALWHYDPHDHRALHDSRFRRSELRVDEARSGHQLQFEIELVAPFEDGITTLLYEGVTSFSSSLPAQPELSVDVSLGDWLCDEIRLSDSKRVVHEFAFSSGATYLIECRTMQHRTTAPPIKHA